MPLVVTEKFGPQAGAEDSLDTGLIKVRRFWVNTRDELRAMRAAGIPRKGNAFGPSEPGLIVIGVRAHSLGGIDDASGYGGLSEVTVTYSVFGTQWSGTPKEVQPPGVKHTVFTSTMETVEVGSAVQDNGDLYSGSSAFNNGKTAPKIVGRTVAEVYDFRPLTDAVPHLTYFNYAADPPLNLFSLTLPPLLGDTQSISVGIKQALYVGYRYEMRPDAKLLVHTLWLAESFKVLWPVLGPDLKPISINGFVANSGQIYRALDLRNIW